MSSEMCEFKDVQMVNEVRTKSLVLVEITCTYLLNEALYLLVLHRGFQMHMKNAGAIFWVTVDDKIGSYGSYRCSEA
jgi:hypothetical protein